MGSTPEQNRRRKARKRAAGECLDCGNPAAQGDYCEHHIQLRAQWTAIRVAREREERAWRDLLAASPDPAPAIRLIELFDRFYRDGWKFADAWKLCEATALSHASVREREGWRRAWRSMIVSGTMASIYYKRPPVVHITRDLVVDQDPLPARQHDAVLA